MTNEVDRFLRSAWHIVFDGVFIIPVQLRTSNVNGLEMDEKYKNPVNYRKIILAEFVGKNKKSALRELRHSPIVPFRDFIGHKFVNY